MFKNEEIPSSYVEDYKTLHHDIGLVKRSNGAWDLWFGQDSISERYKDAHYLDIIEGDIVSATEIHSLQVGIIIACLTSWNYLNRTGNPVYTTFGNESYSLLKKNKGVNTKYKIKQFFIDCLNRMRRIYSVESLDVYEVENNPYMYKVKFKVTSITNTIVDGEFYLNTDSTKSTSMIDISYNQPYTSVSNPLFIDCVLRDEYGSVIEGEVIYIYIKDDDNSDFKYYGITEATDNNGRVYITIPPHGLSFNTQVMLVFKGSSTYNPCVSKIINIQSVAYYIKSRYTYKTIEDDNGEKVRVVDKHILYAEDSMHNVLETFRLGELLSDYININNVTFPNDIIIQDIESNYLSENNPLIEYDENNEIVIDENKLYLIPSDEEIEGTDKNYYKAYAWNTDKTKLIAKSYNVQLNTENPKEIHFLINDGYNGFFEINFDDGHLYYRLELLDNNI